MHGGVARAPFLSGRVDTRWLARALSAPYPAAMAYPLNITTLRSASSERQIVNEVCRLVPGKKFVDWFSWVAGSTYQGQQVIDGRLCDQYSKPSSVYTLVMDLVAGTNPAIPVRYAPSVACCNVLEQMVSRTKLTCSCCSCRTHICTQIHNIPEPIARDQVGVPLMIACLEASAAHWRGACRE